jgi:phosphoribosylformylglycinamidine synthase
MLRAAVVRFPGSNCDFDTLRAAQRVGADAYFVWHREAELRGADIVLLPGGFSYGDYLRSGAIARFSPVMQAVQRHAQAGGPVLGICNGFQILCEAHLLPGALMRNAGLTFVSKPVDVIVERPDTDFTSAYEQGARLRLPVAHGDGRFVATEDTLRELEAEGRVVLRYVASTEGSPYQPNPNGSAHHIAGICNAGGNVVGIMPHPERAAEPLLGLGDGAGFFSSMAAWQPRASTSKVTSR